MKQIKLIKDEQVLEQISGGRALMVRENPCQAAFRAVLAVFGRSKTKVIAERY
jgi:hypothetical protein